MFILVDEMPKQGAECLFGIQDTQTVWAFNKVAINYTKCPFTNKECNLDCEKSCPVLKELEE